MYNKINYFLHVENTCPFKTWFASSIVGITAWEYRGVLDMQEYLPAERVDITINKFQSFLVWFFDFKIFTSLKNFWTLLTNSFGLAKYIVIFIIIAFISIILYRLLHNFYNIVLPKRIVSEKKGLEYLHSMVKNDPYAKPEQTNVNTTITKEVEQQKTILYLENEVKQLKDFINANLTNSKK